MAQKEPPADKSVASAMAKMMPTELFGLGQQRSEALMEFQRELLASLEQTNKGWLDRMKLEAELASELTAKLAAAKSIPDAASVYQEWMGRRMDLLRQDAQKIMDDSQKLMNTSARILSGGTAGGGT